MLMDTDVSNWVDTQKALSTRTERSRLDYALGITVEYMDDQLKQCFLDFGLFAEDQQIAATSLLNMWVHLYDHDDDGSDTLDKIIELSKLGCVTSTTTG